MRRFAFAALALALSSAALAAEPPAEPITPTENQLRGENLDEATEKVTIETEDGWELAGLYVQGVNKGEKNHKCRAVILVHMLGREKNDWKPLMKRFYGNGCAVLAFDLRGHGASVRADGVARPWRKFKRRDWAAAEKDILAARDWLLKNKETVDPDRIALVGASIGANLCLRALGRDEKLRGAVLLSPGLDYRGVTTEDALERVRPGQRVAAFACSNDLQSATCVRTLERMLQAFERERRESFTAKVYSGRTITAATGGLHGTRMLGRVKGIEEEVLDFLNSALAPRAEEEQKEKKEETKPSLDRTLDALRRAL